MSKTNSKKLFYLIMVFSIMLSSLILLKEANCHSGGPIKVDCADCDVNDGPGNCGGSVTTENSNYTGSPVITARIHYYYPEDEDIAAHPDVPHSPATPGHPDYVNPNIEVPHRINLADDLANPIGPEPTRAWIDCTESATDNSVVCNFHPFKDCAYFGTYTAMVEIKYEGTHRKVNLVRCGSANCTTSGSCGDSSGHGGCSHSTGTCNSQENPVFETGTSDGCTCGESTGCSTTALDTHHEYMGISGGSATTWAIGNYATYNLSPPGTNVIHRLEMFNCSPSNFLANSSPTMKISKSGVPLSEENDYITLDDAVKLNLLVENTMDFRTLSLSAAQIDEIRRGVEIEFYYDNPCGPATGNPTVPCTPQPTFIGRTNTGPISDMGGTTQISLDWEVGNEPVTNPLDDIPFAGGVGNNTITPGEHFIWVWIDSKDGATINSGSVAFEHANLQVHDGLIPETIPYNAYDPGEAEYTNWNPSANKEQDNLTTDNLFAPGPAKIIVKSKPNLRLFVDPAAPSTTNISVTCTGLLLKICDLAAKIENDTSGVDADYTADAKNILVTFKINSEEPYNAVPAPLDFKLLGTQTIDVPGTRGGNMPGETTTDTIYWIDFGTGFNLNVEVNPDVSDVLDYLGRVVIETDYSDNSVTKPRPP